MTHRGENAQMMTCTECRAVVERTPYRSGACPGWPCHAHPRPEAQSRLDALLQPGPDTTWPSTAQLPRLPAPTTTRVRPTRTRRLAALRPRRLPAARIPVQAVAAVLVAEVASGR
ncbi:hypothetical protein [Kitasatospora sp. NPDC058218]|uniref:hypothetical protein n=1 Tax=Kitasatospora sp. NPDC058218 TaxID=3346385 RepID=UPI0036DEB068